MGITDRKQREKEELEQLIMSTAARLFRENGFEKTSIRSIAKEIEYSPGTIYLYFKDKDELFYKMSVKAFEVFFTYLTQVMTIKDPMERLHKLGIQYVKFAMENPAYYDLMFILKAPIRSISEYSEWDEGAKSHTILLDSLKRCKDAGYFKKHDLMPLSFMVWGTVHGIVSMKIRDRMQKYEDQEIDQLIWDAVSIFNDGLTRL